MTRVIILLMAAIFIVGCGERKVEEAPVVEVPEAEPESAFAALFSEARERYSEGDTDAAVDLLVEGLADPQYAANQSTIFRSLLELLLLEDRIVDAQTNYLAMLNASPETAVDAFGAIPSHLKRREDPSDYLAWTEQMVNTELPSNVVETAYVFYVDANTQVGNDDKLDELAQVCCERFGGAASARIFARPINALIDKEKYDVVRILLSRLSATDDPSAANLVTSTEMTMAAAMGQWDFVVSTFATKAARLPDSGSKLMLRTVCGCALKAGRTDVVDKLCEQVIGAMPDAAATRKQAVSSYMDVVVKAKNYVDAVARLQGLKAWGVDSSLIGQRLSAVFYDTMGSTGAETKKAALELVEWVLSETTDDGRRTQYQALLMDGSVLSDDYKRALGVLESGFRVEDAEWHSMAINKVGAHLALQEGRTDDAVAMFRKFMVHVGSWTEATTDPSTGLTHTREMNLGFNAKRIGDILRDAGKADEAAKAYAEAREYYDAALKIAKEDSREHAHIKKSLAEIPDVAPVPAP